MAVLHSFTKKLTLRFELTTVIVALVAFSISLVLQTQLVLHFGVNFPYWDEWEDFPQIQADFKDHQLTWQQVFATHNEHRPAVPRLITLGLFVMLGRWSPLAAMLVSALLVACTAGIWAYTIHRLGMAPWIAWVSAFLLASPIHYENMLWGFQTCFYVLILSLVVGVARLALVPSVGWLDVCIAGIAALCGTLSLASGALLWPIFGVCMILNARRSSRTYGALLYDRRFMLKLCAYGLATVMVVLLYVPGIHSKSMEIPISNRIVDIAVWSLMALAYPLAATHDLPVVYIALMAAIIWLPALVAVWYWLKKMNRSISPQVILLVGIGASVVLSALAIGFGRSRSTLVDTPHYVTIFVWSTLLALCCYDLLRTRLGNAVLTPQRRKFAVLFMAALFVIYGWQSARGVKEMIDDKAIRQDSERMVTAYLHDSNPERQLGAALPYPRADRLKLRLDNPRIISVLPPELTR